MALLKNKFVVIALAGIVLASVVWYSFMRDDSTELLATEDLTEATSVDSDVVGVLLQLRAVSLSGTIFTDPAFQALQDFGSEIIPEPVGRPNPFAPLGGTATATTSAGQRPATSR
jgi:hypothetical protein